jgi:hypothetical protein
MDLYRWLRNQWDRTIAIVLGLAGLLAIYLGYRGVRDGVVPAEQIPYLASGGILGLFLLGAGATLWLSSDLRDEWRKLDTLADEVRAVGEKLERVDDGLEADQPQVPARRRREPLRPDGH